MSYTIVPQSDLYILSGVGFNNSYNDIYYKAPLDYFISKTKFKFDDFSYIRRNGTISVPVNQEGLNDCNYILFRNDGFNYSGKMIFAFITGVDYINPETSEIHFEIDEYQTWKNEIVIEQCFVEREHVNNDTIGANTVPENINFGDMIDYSDKTCITATDYLWIVYYTEKLEVPGENPPGFLDKISETQKNIYIPYYWASTTTAQLETLFAQIIAALIAKKKSPDIIVGVYGYPYGTFSSVTPPSRTNKYGNYTPKNNKCLVYPYQYINCYTPGSSQIFKYELFEGSPSFKMHYSYSPDGGGVIFPENYIEKSNKYSWGITFNSTLQAGIRVNSALYGLNKALPGMINGAMDGLVNMGASSLSGNIIPGGYALTAISLVTNALGGVISSVFAPDTVKGQAKTNVFSQIMPNDKAGPILSRIGIKEEYAKIIDEFFTRYGYKVNRLKRPNVTGRTYFNYVKTINSCVTGECPTYTQQKLEEVLDRGVTFWHTSDIGNFNVVNSIL